MSEHDQIRELLPLVASGEAAPEEIQRVQEHWATCAECRNLSEDFAALGNALCGLPTPQPSTELLNRVRLMAIPRLARRRTRRRDALVLALLVTASWLTAIATWPWFRAAGTWTVAGWHFPSGGFAQVLAAYSIFGFLLASAAAIAVSRKANGRAQ